jgi:sodium pump decarboxylase gamma subunit
MEGSTSVLTFGLTVALIGMGTVFFALVLLVGFIQLMGMATSLSLGAKTPKVVMATGAVAASAPVPGGDGEEVLAVIAAAVAAYTRKP